MSRTGAALLGVLVMLVVPALAVETGIVRWALGATALLVFGLAVYFYWLGAESNPPQPNRIPTAPEPAAPDPDPAEAPDVSLDPSADPGAVRLGVDLGTVEQGKFEPVVPAGTPLPARATLMRATTRGDQRRLEVALHTRHGRAPALPLAQIQMLGLPPGRAGSARVVLVVDVDACGRTHLWATNPDADVRLPIEIDRQPEPLPIMVPRQSC